MTARLQASMIGTQAWLGPHVKWSEWICHPRTHKGNQDKVLRNFFIYEDMLWDLFNSFQARPLWCQVSDSDPILGQLLIIIIMD